MKVVFIILTADRVCIIKPVSLVIARTSAELWIFCEDDAGDQSLKMEETNVSRIYQKTEVRTEREPEGESDR